MKRNMLTIVAALTGAILVTGCGQKEETTTTLPATPPAATKAAPSTTAPANLTEAASKTVTDLLASAKGSAEQALSLAKEGKYQDALALLQRTAAEVQANPDAMKLVNDAIAQVKKMMADAAAKGATDKAASEASKALGGLGQ